MSLNDDCELQDLVKKTLEKSGSMSKIRAELRANVFLALEENGCLQNLKSKNIELENFAKKSDGILLLCLIREFLEYFGLSFTASVFDPELASYGIEYNCKDHSRLYDELNVTCSSSDGKKTPFLCQMLQIIRNMRNNLRTQTMNSLENLEENSHLHASKSTDTSTEYYPLQPLQSKNGKNTERSKERNLESENTIKPFTKINYDTKTNISPSQTFFGKEADLLKSSPLGDLPPLLSHSSSNKSSSNVHKASKQMYKLKAMLSDSPSSGNNCEISGSSVISDDEIYEDISEIDELFSKKDC
ncbi:hypothetical protein PGB90_006389 [Kerria lacca]